MSILFWIGLTLEGALLAGLLVRRRVRQCYALLPLAAEWLTTDGMVALCPGCNTWELWTSKELLHALLAFAVGVELSWRMLLGTTRGQCAAMAMLGINLCFAVMLVATAPPGSPSVTLLPRLMAGLATLYLGLLWVLARHAIPLARPHRAILGGLAVHSILYWMTWSHTGTETTVAGFVNPVVFLGVLVTLAWAVWTADDVPPVQPELVKLVQPWTR